MKINTENWKEFKIDNIFEIERGKISNLNDIEKGKCPIVSAYGENQGVAFFGNVRPKYSNCITASFNGSKTGYFSYHEYEFNANSDCGILLSKFHMNKYIGLFFCVILNKMAVKYQYGRKLTIDRLKNETILLPYKDNDIDFNYIESFIKSIKSKHIVTKNKNNNKLFNVNHWQEYKISDLFDVVGTKTTKIEDLESHGEGIYPYITTQAVNNGVAGKFNYFTEKGNVLTIDSAVLGYCSYQPKNFSASDHVEKLIPKFIMNKYVALFLVTLFNNECYKYSYGRKANQIKIKNTLLRLPTKNNQPDWEYMENYIRSLPYADRI